MEAILAGFEVALQPHNIFYVFLGVVLGTVFGMMPGIGAASGIALLIPVTFGMDPTSALIMLAGIYYGTMYGNSISAVLIRTPGNGAAMMTTLDGYPMAQNGRAGAALAISAIASFAAGTVGVLLLSVLAVPIAQFALKFGPAEYFAVMLFSLTAVGSLSGGSVLKGLLAALLGLMIATVGLDLQTGQARFTMGIMSFTDGIPIIVQIVGLFAVAEVFAGIDRWRRGEAKPIPLKGKIWLTGDEWRRSRLPILRGGLSGFAVGVLPGASGVVATAIAYTVEHRLSKSPERFGRGAIEGVAAPEAANNASTCGAMVPMLTLGIPGSTTTAVLLGAFVLYGITPGPRLLHDHPELVWGLIDSMYVGNLILLALNLPLVGVFARLLYIPPGILMAIIMVIASVGVYTTGSNSETLFLLLGFGVIGYLFRCLDVPVAPMILAVVLGGIMEQAFRQAMTISGGSIEIFVTRPISAFLLVLSAVAIFAPMILARSRQRKGPQAPAATAKKAED